MLGDSGCRVNTTENALQACDDPAAWPFAEIAATAARLAPDLVIHVGDYLYRETACPPTFAGCRGSPWGYGWDAWHADLFVPAAPLMAAAPWIVVRGNHEICARAGQGWFRFLDPRPFDPLRSCDDADADGDADYSPTYAVPIANDTQLDGVRFVARGIPASVESEPQYGQYRAQFEQARALAGDTGKVEPLHLAPPVAGASYHSAMRSRCPATPRCSPSPRRLFGTTYFPAGVVACTARPHPRLSGARASTGHSRRRSSSAYRRRTARPAVARSVPVDLAPAPGDRRCSDDRTPRASASC